MFVKDGVKNGRSTVNRTAFVRGGLIELGPGRAELLQRRDITAASCLQEPVLGPVVCDGALEEIDRRAQSADQNEEDRDSDLQSRANVEAVADACKVSAVSEFTGTNASTRVPALAPVVDSIRFASEPPGKASEGLRISSSPNTGIPSVTPDHCADGLQTAIGKRGGQSDPLDLAR